MDIDPALPVKHITRVGRPRYVNGKPVIYISGGHTAKYADEIIAVMQQERAKQMDMRLSASKTFFPPQPDEQLLGWLAETLPGIL